MNDCDHETHRRLLDRLAERDAQAVAKAENDLFELAERDAQASASRANALFDDVIPQLVRRAQRSGFFVGFLSGVLAGVSVAWILVVARSL